MVIVKCRNCDKEFQAAFKYTRKRFCGKECESQFDLKMASLPEKKCRHCHIVKPRSSFYLQQGNYLFSECKECQKKRTTLSRQSKDPSEKKRWARYSHNSRVRRYGLEPKDYEYILTIQDGKCAICRSPQPSKRTQRMHVDHDHASNLHRGLLCINCNMGLGRFKDNPSLLRYAAQYLDAWKQGREEQKIADELSNLKPDCA